MQNITTVIPFEVTHENDQDNQNSSAVWYNILGVLILVVSICSVATNSLILFIFPK